MSDRCTTLSKVHIFLFRLQQNHDIFIMLVRNEELYFKTMSVLHIY